MKNEKLTEVENIVREDIKANGLNESVGNKYSLIFNDNIITSSFESDDNDYEDDFRVQEMYYCGQIANFSTNKLIALLLIDLINSDNNQLSRNIDCLFNDIMEELPKELEADNENHFLNILRELKYSIAQSINKII